jgi:hypothetical protein
MARARLQAQSHVSPASVDNSLAKDRGKLGNNLLVLAPNNRLVRLADLGNLIFFHFFLIYSEFEEGKKQREKDDENEYTENKPVAPDPRYLLITLGFMLSLY